MEDSEHRALWGALGVALLISGIVVLSDWTFIAVAAPPSRDLTALWWPWAGALVMMILGVYALIAVSNERLPLPGRRAQLKRRHLRETAEAMLARFHLWGARMSLDGTSSQEQYEAWAGAVFEFVQETWGLDQSIVLMPPNHLVSVIGGFRETTELLTRLIERCRMLPIKEGFNPVADPPPIWITYWEIPLPQDENEAH